MRGVPVNPRQNPAKPQLQLRLHDRMSTACLFVAIRMTPPRPALALDPEVHDLPPAPPHVGRTPDQARMLMEPRFHPVDAERNVMSLAPRSTFNSLLLLAT